MTTEQTSSAPGALGQPVKRSGPFLPGIEACRGIAALMVLFFHSSARLVDRQYFDFQSPVIERWMRFGPTGVDLFFVISGFIIFHAHRNDIGNRGALRQYLWRRILRIYPVYWAILAVMLALYFLFPSSGEAYQRDFIVIIKSIFLLPDPLPPINNAAWTLRHEMLFYIIFSLLIFSRFFGVVFFTFWSIGMFAAVFFNFTFPWSFFFYVKNIEFLMGMVTAFFCISISSRLAPWVTISGVFIFLVVGVGRDFYPWFEKEPMQTIFLGMGAALIIGGLSRLPFLNVNGFLLYFGKISYPLYIIQPLSIPILCHIIVNMKNFIFINEAIVFLIIVFGTIVSAHLLHKFVEVPVLNFTRRRRYEWQVRMSRVESAEGGEKLL